MFAIIIMLLVLLEVFVAGSMVLFFMKSRKNIVETNKQIVLIKKEVINVLTDYRISIRMLNQQVKNIKTEQQTKQMMEMLNFLGTISLFFGIKKKKLI